MAYKGLASVMSPKQDIETLEKLAAKKKAEHLASKRAVGENVVGIPAAIAAGVLTKGNPAAIMSAYQAGKGIGGMGADALSGGAPSQQSMNEAMSGASGLIGATKEMKAAEEAAKKTKQFNEMYKFLLG